MNRYEIRQALKIQNQFVEHNPSLQILHSPRAQRVNVLVKAGDINYRSKSITADSRKHFFMWHPMTVPLRDSSPKNEYHSKSV